MKEKSKENFDEIKKIKGMNNKDLLEQFENLIRRGAGPGYIKVTWIRREILERMKSRDMQQKEMYPDKEAADEALAH